MVVDVSEKHTTYTGIRSLLSVIFCLCVHRSNEGQSEGTILNLSNLLRASLLWLSFRFHPNDEHFSVIKSRMK